MGALSGNALCDQYLQNEPAEASRELATRLECGTERGEDIINCLKRKTQQDIITASQQMFMFWSFPRWFAPSVDGNVLPDTPENLLLQGKFQKFLSLLDKPRMKEPSSTVLPSMLLIMASMMTTLLITSFPESCLSF